MAACLERHRRAHHAAIGARARSSLCRPRRRSGGTAGVAFRPQRRRRKGGRLRDRRRGKVAAPLGQQRGAELISTTRCAASTRCPTPCPTGCAGSTPCSSRPRSNTRSASTPSISRRWREFASIVDTRDDPRRRATWHYWTGFSAQSDRRPAGDRDRSLPTKQRRSRSRPVSDEIEAVCAILSGPGLYRRRQAA